MHTHLTRGAMIVNASAHTHLTRGAIIVRRLFIQVISICVEAVIPVKRLVCGNSVKRSRRFKRRDCEIELGFPRCTRLMMSSNMIRGVAPTAKSHTLAHSLKRSRNLEPHKISILALHKLYVFSIMFFLILSPKDMQYYHRIE